MLFLIYITADNTNIIMIIGLILKSFE